MRGWLKISVGNVSGRRGVEGVWDADSRYIPRPKVGDGGKVVGYISGIISMCTGERVQRREAAWKTLVETRGSKGGS